MWPITSARLATTTAGVMAVAVVVSALVYGSRVASGSDSYGYVSQADLWLNGQLKVRIPAAYQVPWPNFVRTFAPLGYRPAGHGPVIVPTYSPGLPLLMAGAKSVAGHPAVFWIVPICAGLLVLATYRIGRTVGSNGVGLAAAWLVATSPVVLYQSMLPMSDVPAAAFWALTTLWVLADTVPFAALAGLAASVAILIRPNLAPIAGVCALWIGWQDLRGWSGGRRFGRTLIFSLGVIPGCLAIARINKLLYGSPFTSGYGTAADVMSTSHVAANARLYFGWLVETHTVVALAGVLALMVPLRWLWRNAHAQRGAVLLGSIALTNIVVYLTYLPFETWTYLRFLLPAWPAIFIGLAVSAARAFETRRAWTPIAGALLIGGLGVYEVRWASTRGVFRIGRLQDSYVGAALLVKTMTDPSSVVFAMQHSGSVRYYGARTTIRYDDMDSQWLDRSVEWLQQHGAHPYLLVEVWERENFRRQFSGASPLGRLEMAPIAVYGGPTTIFLYDLASQDMTRPWPAPIEGISVPRCAQPDPAPVLDFALSLHRR